MERRLWAENVGGGTEIKKLFLWLIALCLLLTACAGSGNQSGESASGDRQVSSDSWKQGFAGGRQDSLRDLSGANASYHTVSRASIVPEEPAFSFTDRRWACAYSDEEDIFLLSYLTEDGWSYYLQRYDIQNGSLLPGEQVFQEEELQGHFDRLCISGENELVALFVSEDEEGNPREIRVFTFDREGGEVSSVPLDYLYQEVASGPMMTFGSFLCDGSYFYLINCYEGGLLVFDREGKEIRRNMPDPSAGRYYTGSCSAPDGSVIASRVSMEDQKTEFFLLQGKTEERLGEAAGTFHRVFAMGEDGSFYYFMSDWLIRWNTATGEQTPLLDGAVEGMDTAFLSALTFSDNGRVLLHGRSETEEEGLEILTCSEEEVEAEISKLVFAVDAEIPGLYYRSLPVEYSKDHPENPIELETYEGDYEAYHTRLMADILNGGGPDILLLKNKDVRNLYENDALLDLTEFLDPELKEKIFPGALECGMLDGKLIGLDPSIRGYAMLVSNAAWEGDSWTIEDLVRLVDERKPRDLFAYSSGWGSTNSPWYLLSTFLGEFPEKSSFLNLETGTCDFENETFIRFLEICKEYGEKPALEEDQLYEELKTGECLATQVSLYDMATFSKGMKPLEESCHLVGFPGQDGYGVRGSYDMLVINANTENRERALEFLWDLLSVEEQKKLIDGASMREDVIRECVMERGSNPMLGLHAGYDIGGGAFKELEVKADGKSFVEEFVAAVGGLEVPDSRSAEIFGIIEEEADLFFEGSRTAEETAKVTQNRVKLYLDENK